MNNKIPLFNTLSQAFSDAISDRLQFANDNQSNSPDYAMTARAQAASWQALRKKLIGPGVLRVTRQKIRQLSNTDLSSFITMLNFAQIARLAVIESNQGALDVRSDISHLRAYRQLYQEFYPEQKDNTVAIDPRDVAKKIPDECWEDTPCGGKVFIPNLPE